VEELEDNHDEARQALEKLNEIVEKLSAPALRIGTFLNRLENGNLLVCANGTDFVCSVHPDLPEAGLESGVRVLLNEAMAVTEIFGFDRGGPVVKIADVLQDGRLRIAQEGGLNDGVVMRSTLLAKEKLRPGLEVRLDPNQRIATEVIETTGKVKRSLTTVEQVPWDHVGGQEEAVEAIRDSIELPHLHPELFQKFDHPVPKGILLYGPPGCGKTLLGKATAYNLRQQLHERTGEDHPEFFLHVKGPEILNMWLGESERQVRELFSQCREKAAEGHLSFLFIDEAESILGTRMGGRMSHNIVSTLVPMFCTEMDGIEPLQNVIVILASNRADLIDPAILRPGRVDRKIRVTRPDREAAREIYRIYLTEELPLAEDRSKLIDAITDAHYAETEETRFLEIVFRSGRREFLHRGNLSSGALIAAIVERAKSYAIKRSVSQEGKLSPIQREDLLRALNTEYQENELFPPTDVTEDWLKLTDFDAENVVKLTPFRAGKSRGKSPAI
jgi:proteasome-associated ATPase